MAIILDGRTIGARIREKVKARMTALERTPLLAVILVGNDPASELYVSLKQRACEEAGIHFELHRFAADAPEEALLAKIDVLNGRNDVTGILVQLPLPSQDADRVISRIHPNKDVDGFHPENLCALSEGRPGIVSALALGIAKLVDEGQGKGNAMVVGSEIVARPLRALLSERGFFVERVDADDATLGEKTKTADVLIVAVGRAGLISASMVKSGAVVIDVGTNRVGTKTVGDVDPDVANVAGALSPVPGGVGPMTVAMLLLNVLKAETLQGSQNAKVGNGITEF